MSRLLARHAECLFWLGRYIERAGSLARIIEVQASFNRGRRGEAGWKTILRLYSDEKRFAEFYDEATAENITRFYITDLRNSGSIQWAIRAARENARALRPLISQPMWGQINEFYNRFLGISAMDLSDVRLARTCAMIQEGCSAQAGATDTTFYRDEAWRFLRIGVAIERADQTSRLLDVKYSETDARSTDPQSPASTTFWHVLLRSCAAYHAYQRVIATGIQPKDVARFLLFDRHFPRSVAYSLAETEHLLQDLRGPFGLTKCARPLEAMHTIQAGLDTARRDGTLTDHLHPFNDWMQLALIALCDQLGQAFFGYEQAEDDHAPLPAGPISAQSQTQSQLPAP